MKPRKLGKIGKYITFYENFIKFQFCDHKYGYILEDYLPKNVINAVRFRDLVIVLNKLHHHMDGFKSLRLLKKRGKNL